MAVRQSQPLFNDCGDSLGVEMQQTFFLAQPGHSMLKFFDLDVSLVGGVAVSNGPAPDSAFAPSFLGRPFGQLP